MLISTCFLSSDSWKLDPLFIRKTAVSVVISSATCSAPRGNYSAYGQSVGRRVEHLLKFSFREFRTIKNTLSRNMVHSEFLYRFVGNLLICCTIPGVVFSGSFLGDNVVPELDGQRFPDHQKTQDTKGLWVPKNTPDQSKHYLYV